MFFFRADPHAIDVLKIAGVNCVSLANNHTLDFGEEALLEMLNRLDEAGIAHAGAGRNLREASKPAVIEAGGLRVGVVSFTDNESAFAAKENSPGTNYIPITLADKIIKRCVQPSTRRARWPTLWCSPYTGDRLCDKNPQIPSGSLRML